MRFTGLVLLTIFVLAFASFAQEQKVRTVTGHLCKSDTAGAAVGTIYLRVGTQIVEITHLHTLFHGDRGPLSRYINKPDFYKIGSEFVVRYRRLNSQNEAISIRFTGRTKKIKPCLPD